MRTNPDAADFSFGGVWDQSDRDRTRRAGALRTPRRRAIVVLALLGAGMLFGRELSGAGDGVIGSGALLLVSLAGALLGVCARGRWACGALGIAVVCAGAGWWTLRVAERPADDIWRLLSDEAVVVTVVGLVEESPRIAGTQRGALAPFARHDQRVARFTLGAAGVVDADGAIQGVSGRLYVRVDAPDGVDDRALASALPRAGGWVRVTGLASRLRSPSNAGEIDFRPIAAARGISGAVRSASPSLVRPVEPPPGLVARLRSAREVGIDAVRATSGRVLAGATGDRDSPRSALLSALLLGERDGGYHELSAPFVRLGVSHVLAISGLHVGIFVWFLAMLVRLTGDHWRLEALVVVLSVALLLVLIPARAPVVRAGAIIGGFAIAGLFGRRYDALNTLSWIAVGVLLWRPTELLNPGFQLSFGIVAALIALTGPVRDRLFGAKRDPDHRTGPERVVYWTQDALCASACAWLVSLPVVMHHFGIVTIYAPIVSLIILPLVGLVLVLGYGAIAAALLWPEGGALLGAMVDVAGSWILSLVTLLDGAPGATLRVPSVGAWWAAIGTVVIWFWLAGGVRRLRRLARRSRNPRGWACAVFALCGAAGIIVVGWPLLLVARGVAMGAPHDPGQPGTTASIGPTLRWDAIDVGDGSAHIVRTLDDTLMFDCGSSWYGIGERTIPNAARALGAWRVPTVIISHPDGDHYSGLLDCVEPLGIRRVLVGGAFVDEARDEEDGADRRARFVLAELERMGVEVAEVWAGDVVELGGAGAVLEFLSPARGSTWERDNDASLVALVTVPDPSGFAPDPVRLLLTGDIEADAMADVESALRERGLWEGGILAMEAPHHGSARGFAYDFVRGVSPRMVIQSTGPSRVGDERWDPVKHQIDTWCITARDGGISAWLYPDGGVVTESWKNQ